MKKDIFLFTHSYPYHKGEDFIETELLVASKLDVNLTIIPLFMGKECRRIPSNIKICSGLAKTSVVIKCLLIFRVVYSQRWWNLVFAKNSCLQGLKQYILSFKYLYGAFLIEYFLLKNRTLFIQNSIFYSYWFNYTTLGIIWAKEHSYYKDIRVYSRAHGYDVYENLRGVYFPYRLETFGAIEKLFVVSKTGRDFLKIRYPDFADKIKLAHLGVFKINSIVGYKHSIDQIAFVSCSNIIPLKRVDLIYSSIVNYAIQNPSLKIKWVHIGGGSGYEELKLKINRQLINNIDIQLMGFVKHEQILDLYSKETFDVFINMSVSEGIPVSIMEAISAKIPIIATDVGGNSEIVTEKTGVLLPVKFSQHQFDIAVKKVIVDHEKLEKSSSDFYEQNFNAEINYCNFYNNMLQ